MSSISRITTRVSDRAVAMAVSVSDSSQEATAAALLGASTRIPIPNRVTMRVVDARLRSTPCPIATASRFSTNRPRSRLRTLTPTRAMLKTPCRCRCIRCLRSARRHRHPCSIIPLVIIPNSSHRLRCRSCRRCHTPRLISLLIRLSTPNTSSPSTATSSSQALRRRLRRLVWIMNRSAQPWPRSSRSTKPCTIVCR